MNEDFLMPLIPKVE